MTYKELEKVNGEMKTIDVKGKPYPEVVEKIKAFKKIYPDGTIETQLLSDDDGKCVFKAVVSVTDATGQTVILGTGHAFEMQSVGYINKTSYIENCETSAVGRALSMAGFGSDKSVASLEELAHAINQQEEQKLAEKNAKKITEKEAAVLAKTLSPDVTKNVLDHYKIKSLNELTGTQYGELMQKLRKE